MKIPFVNINKCNPWNSKSVNVRRYLLLSIVLASGCATINNAEDINKSITGNDETIIINEKEYKTHTLTEEETAAFFGQKVYKYSDWEVVAETQYETGVTILQPRERTSMLSLGCIFRRGATLAWGPTLKFIGPNGYATNVTIDIDGHSYDINGSLTDNDVFIMHRGTGFMLNIRDIIPVINKLKGGTKFTVKYKPYYEDTIVKESISLKGFGEGYSKMMHLCGMG